MEQQATRLAARQPGPQPPQLGSSQAQLESDPFKIYCYKIVPCAKKFGHDWSECPFAHEGEKATRRCPALYLYSSIVCPDVRQSKPCPRGDVCPYSHSIFEYWMHPARFRAQMCSFGADCNRRICFFAHAQDQLRVPSEPIVADALAARAPYLQGRVCPKSRYALYPEQVPPAIPLAGVLPQHLLGHSGVSNAGQGMPQMLMVPAGDPAAVGMPLGAAAGPMGGLQQQWGQGGNIMFVPAGQAAGAAGLGYYLPAGAAGAGGSMAAGAMAQQQFSAGMALPSGVLPQMQGRAGGGGGYSSAQQVQLVTAVGPGGSPAQYHMAAGGLQAGGVAVGPPMYASGLSMPMQPTWGIQQVQQQPQGQLQLVQVAQPGEALAQPAGAQDSSFLLQRPFPPGGQTASRPMDAGGYAMISPAGPAVVNTPVAPSPVAPSAVNTGEAGATRVDDLAQQMGGWRIT